MDFTNKTSLRNLREAINTALVQVAEERGITLNVGNISYTADGASLKLEACAIDDQGEVMTPARRELSNWGATHLGLTPEMFGTKIVRGGFSYSLAGFSSRSRKYPILLKRIGDGKVFKFPPSIAKLVVASAAKKEAGS